MKRLIIILFLFSGVALSAQSAGNETLFFYDASGQRFLKVYKAVGKEEIRTWYLSDGYELREKFTPDGSQKLAGQATRYFYGPDGKRLASQTGEVTVSLASLHYLYAGMFSGTIVGLVKKAYYYAKGALHDTQGRQFFLITLAVFLALYLSYSLYRRWEVYEHRSDQPTYLKQTAFVLIALFLNLSFTSCLGDGRISVVEKNQIYYNLNFDTIYDGLPVGTYYYTHDHLGSGSLITDASGNEYLRIVYDEYGNIDQHRSGKYDPVTGSIVDAAADANKLLLAVKFTGQEYDPETGLYYYNARYYDPALGLFTTPDVYVDGADTTAGYNRYSYVQGNPVKYSDPTGHFILEILGVAAVGAVVGYLAGSAQKGEWLQGDAAFQAATIGAVSSLATYATGGLSLAVEGSMAHAIAGGIVSGGAAGAASGALNAYYNGSNIVHGAIGGATIGAVSGAAFGIIGHTLQAGYDSLVSQDDCGCDVIIGEGNKLSTLDSQGNAKETFYFLDDGTVVTESQIQKEIALQKKLASGAIGEDDLLTDVILLGKGGGQGVKWVRRAVKNGSTFSRGGSKFASSLYKNITNPGAIRNILTNVKPAQFMKTLQQSGFTRSVTSKGVTNFTRGNLRYSIYPAARSTGGATAQFFKDGMSVLKIRLGP